MHRVQEKRQLLVLSTNAKQLGTYAAGVREDPGFPALPYPVLTFAASGPQEQSAFGSLAHTAPSATRGRTGTAPRSHPWRSLCSRQEGSELVGSAQHGGPELWHAASVGPQTLRSVLTPLGPGCLSGKLPMLHPKNAPSKGPFSLRSFGLN